uniref:Uncharacterized protein n=1 Tax=Vespula pensylvanica TaxID=30213 RepID=A0A834PFG7_VESPE|nr:hypothetical protein H0235_001090 [Vespula pensylvanica]
MPGCNRVKDHEINAEAELWRRLNEVMQITKSKWIKFQREVASEAVPTVRKRYSEQWASITQGPTFTREFSSNSYVLEVDGCEECEATVFGVEVAVEDVINLGIDVMRDRGRSWLSA